MRQTGQMMLLLLKNIHDVFKTCVMKEPAANKQRVQTGDKKPLEAVQWLFFSFKYLLGSEKKTLAAVQTKGEFDYLFTWMILSWV